ncbi:MAG: hypothetical protein LBR80_15980 [Deltaproteobacteria bacterium]|nr:hypothetical protein [Deltaproteobacteria bacterium]
MRDGPAAGSPGDRPAFRPLAEQTGSRPEEFPGLKGAPADREELAGWARDLARREEELANRINVVARWEEELARRDKASGDAAALIEELREMLGALEKRPEAPSPNSSNSGVPPSQAPFNSGGDVSGLGVNGPANGGEQRIGRPN